MRRKLMNMLMFFPDRRVVAPHARGGISFEDVAIDTADGQRLHGWWTPALSAPLAHVLLCHGNAGNITSRAAYARILAAAGFDVLLFDYRGYGRSTGRPSEAGTYEDARAARRFLLERDGVLPDRLIYLGESLGAAVALELALAHPPAGVILQSAFTSVRDMAAAVYPFLPRAVVPDAYPSLDLIAGLRAPLLVLHGRHDDVVPLAQGLALLDAAPCENKRIHVFERAGHNDLLALSGDEWAAAIGSWTRESIIPPT